MNSRWQKYFMDLAELAASMSKDRSTKLGAVIVGPDRDVRATGFNGMPRGVNDDVEERHVRPAKYKWTEHAERNALLNAARVGTPMKGCTLFCAWPPCSDCARAIIQAGLAEVIVKSREVPDRWREDMDVAAEMLAEAGVVLREMER